MKSKLVVTSALSQMEMIYNKPSTLEVLQQFQRLTRASKRANTHTHTYIQPLSQRAHHVGRVDKFN